MTVSTTNYFTTASGNGATTVFTFNFIADNASTIQVTYTDTTGVETVLNPAQYTLVINVPAVGQLWGIGGTVTFPISGTPIATGTFLTIERTVPYTQTISIANQGAFYPQAVEQGLDLLELQLQQIQNDLVNTLRAPITDGILDMTLPAAAARAGDYLGFDANGLPVAVPGSVLSTDLSSYTAIATGATTARSMANYFSSPFTPQDFGAVGNGVADDTAAINLWQTALDAQSTGTGFAIGYLPPGTYKVSATMPWKASFIGAGSEGSYITATAGFTGTYMWDCNYTTFGKEMSNLTLDLRSTGTAGTLTSFGSSSAGSAGGSSIGIRNNLTIRSNSLTTYALRATSSVSETGMLTGTTWTGLQITAPLPLYIGNNQDEIVFNAPRFTQVTGGTLTPFVIDGTDIIMNSPYFALTNVNTSTLGLIELSRNNVLICPFLETAVSTNADWVFVLTNNLTNPVIRELKTNIIYSGASANQGLFHVAFATGKPKGNGITLDGYYNLNGSTAPYSHLFSLTSSTAAANNAFTFNVCGNGYELFNSVSAAFAIFATGTTANTNKIWEFTGNIGDIFGTWNAPSAAAAAPIVFSPVTQPANWP